MGVVMSNAKARTKVRPMRAEREQTDESLG